MANRQNVRFRGVFDLSRRSVRAQQLKRTCLLSFFEESLPAFRDHGLNGRRGEIIQAAANNLFPGKTQQLACANTGLPVIAVIVRYQDGRGRMEDDGAEKLLQRFWAMFFEPKSRIVLRRR
jgi:hypothetical protein